jgi:hypothetical protein
MKILEDIFPRDDLHQMSMDSIKSRIACDPNLESLLHLMESQKYGRKGFKQTTSKENDLYCINAYLMEAFLQHYILKAICTQGEGLNNVFQIREAAKQMEAPPSPIPLMKTYRAKYLKKDTHGNPVTIILDHPQ